MSIGNLIYNLPPEIKKKIRCLEKLNIKIINTKYALVFNKTCKKEDIMPIYTNIRLHDPGARNDIITVRYRKQLIDR